MDAQQPAQARQQHDYFCQHCGKGFNAAGMLSHNRDVHPRLFRDKKAGKCSLCWSLYPTKAATEIHELDFHGGRNMVNPKVVEDI